LRADDACVNHLYTADDFAGLLNLHVKTIRRFLPRQTTAISEFLSAVASGALAGQAVSR
jgi:hypothetical protein